MRTKGTLLIVGSARRMIASASGIFRPALPVHDHRFLDSTCLYFFDPLVVFSPKRPKLFSARLPDRVVMKKTADSRSHIPDALTH
jgi:hypothetical protein